VAQRSERDGSNIAGSPSANAHFQGRGMHAASQSVFRSRRHFWSRTELAS
jgi:hypothetical protein